MIRQAVFLVGGRGTRLGALTDALPKPLMPVGGRPFLELLLDNAARFGFEQILLLCGYRSEQVAERLDRRSMRGAEIRCLVESSPQGTAGALREAAAALDDQFLLGNGDSLFDINLLALEAWSPPQPWTAKLALRRVEDAGRYGAVETVPSADGQGARVSAFAARGPARPGVINGGIYVLRKQALDAIGPGPCSLEGQVFPQLAAAGRLWGREIDGFFLDIGLPEALAQAQTLIPAQLRRPAAFLPWPQLAGDAARARAANDQGWWAFGYRPRPATEPEETGPLLRRINAGLRPAGGHLDGFYWAEDAAAALAQARQEWSISS